ncbi:MAG: DNA mismatch endonuclease Vsr [Calditrichaeota bacterium]|nr:MAG: DNA mismatch endonuclease Vsr [Calditrichota bacterium]
MTDSLSEEKRQWNMSRIRSCDTKPEYVLRSLLHRAGYRFRLKTRDLPGRPDVILARRRSVIFVHGCFWHRHPGCSRATVPGTHQERWLQKFEKNQRRDAEVKTILESMGWQVIIVWECELMRSPELVLEKLIPLLGPLRKKTYHIPSRKELLQVAEERFKLKFAKNSSSHGDDPIANNILANSPKL